MQSINVSDVRRGKVVHLIIEDDSGASHQIGTKQSIHSAAYTENIYREHIQSIYRCTESIQSIYRPCIEHVHSKYSDEEEL